jgi:hypothetical protein
MPDTHPGVLWVRASSGPVLIIAGLELMPVSYPLGVVFVYFGFALAIYEVVTEEWLRVRPYQFQIALLAVVLALIDIFTITVVAAQYPLGYFVLVDDGHASGETVDGVAWQPEFNEEKIILTSGDNSFDNIDLFFELGGTAIQGVVTKGGSHCDLAMPDIINGESYIGHGAYAAGMNSKLVQNGQVSNQPLKVFASDTYRLICHSIPANSSVGVSLLLSGMRVNVSNADDKVVIDKGMIRHFSTIDSYFKFTPKRLWVHGSADVGYRHGISINGVIEMKLNQQFK